MLLQTKSFHTIKIIIKSLIEWNGGSYTVHLMCLMFIRLFQENFKS